MHPKLEYYQNTGDYMKKFESGFNKHSNTTDKSISGIITLDLFVDVTGFVDSIKVKRSLSLERDIQFIQTFKEATMAGYAILRVKSKAVAYRMEQSASVGQTNKND